MENQCVANPNMNPTREKAKNNHDISDLLIENALLFLNVRIVCYPEVIHGSVATSRLGDRDGFLQYRLLRDYRGFEDRV